MSSRLSRSGQSGTPTSFVAAAVTVAHGEITITGGAGEPVSGGYGKAGATQQACAVPSGTQDPQSEHVHPSGVDTELYGPPDLG